MFRAISFNLSVALFLMIIQFKFRSYRCGLVQIIIHNHVLWFESYRCLKLRMRQIDIEFRFRLPLCQCKLNARFGCVVLSVLTKVYFPYFVRWKLEIRFQMPPRKHVFCYKVYHQMKYKLPSCCKERIAEDRVRKWRIQGKGPGGRAPSYF